MSLRAVFAGKVVSGLGQGAAFTQLDWARKQFLTKLGIDPYPGTLNLLLDTPSDLEQWGQVKSTSGISITPPDSKWCKARCYRVRVGDRLPGALLFPQVRAYPGAQVEVIAAVSLRQALSLGDDDRLLLRLSPTLRVRAVIFDVDGTLVDSIEAYQRVAELAAAPHGISITREMVRRALNTNEAFWDLALPLDQPDRDLLIQHLKEDAARQWQAALLKYGRTFPRVRETLELLQGAGVRLGIVTGSRSSSLESLDESGLTAFDAIITCRDVARRKPDPEGLLKCAAQLGIKPSEAVYVGDTPLDIQAAHAAGMAAVAVLTGAGDSASLSAAGADCIISSVGQLAEVLELNEPLRA